MLSTGVIGVLRAVDNPINAKTWKTFIDGQDAKEAENKRKRDEKKPERDATKPSKKKKKKANKEPDYEEAFI